MATKTSADEKDIGRKKMERQSDEKLQSWMFKNVLKIKYGLVSPCDTHPNILFYYNQTFHFVLPEQNLISLHSPYRLLSSSQISNLNTRIRSLQYMYIRVNTYNMCKTFKGQARKTTAACVRDEREK